MKKNSPVLQTLRLLIPLMIVPIFWIFYMNGQLGSFGDFSFNLNAPDPWPPVVGQPYPDLELIDQEGQEFKLSYLKGKVIIVEPIGMNCPACQAFSGAHEAGPYENNAVAHDLKDFEKIFTLYSKGLRLPSPDVVFVQLLLYDMKMDAPTKEDARKWAEHFNISKDDNHFVAVFPHDMRGPASFKMIPGFYLIDRNFILRSDATGHHPKHDLYRTLIPMTPKLVKQKAQ